LSEKIVAIYIYICTGYWWGNLRERDHLEDPGVDGKINTGGGHL
jgi:hypothetical protein